MLPGRIDRVAGSELFLLLDKNCQSRLELTRHRVRNLITLVTDNDVDLFRSESGGRAGNMRDQREPAETVKHLCQVRTHPRSEPGGEDKDVEIFMFVANIFHKMLVRE